MQAEELWRPVVGFEGVYSVSDHGRVRRDLGYRNVTQVGRILKPVLDRYGYQKLIPHHGKLTRQVTFHVLVAETFIGNRPAPSYEVNHKDCDKTNNHARNLEYVTSGDNSRHAAAAGLLARGERQHCAKLTVSAVREIKNRLAGGEIDATLAKEFRVSLAAIWKVRTGRSWKHVS